MRPVKEYVFKEKDLREKFNIPDNEQIIVVAALDYLKEVKIVTLKNETNY